MRLRARLRVGLSVAVAAGALTVAVQLPAASPADRPANAAAAAPSPVPAGADVPPTAARARPPTARPLPAAATRPRLTAALPRSTSTAGTATEAATQEADASRPREDGVDPRSGGVIPLAGAHGTVADPGRLGPVHLDPVPPGVSLSLPDDTAALLARSGAEPAAQAYSDEPFAASATSPVGAPGIRALTQHVRPSCSGTGTDGNRVQVLYVHGAGTRSRYTPLLPVLRNEVANVDDVFALSARQTGGERRVRWVHRADCLPTIKDVTVPDKALGADFWATVDAVKALGYTHRDRKYLMFADSAELCGVGTVYDDLRPSGNLNDGRYASYARVDTPCWSSGHSTAAHELTHMLGGVLPTAPHATKNGHCRDEFDIMCYDDGSGLSMRQVCPTTQEQLLDCNHDDYFDTDPPRGSFLARNWNTARSTFLDVVAATATPPDVKVAASTASARTGEPVVLTASSSRTVSWSWSSRSPGCALTAGSSTATAGRATLVCPSSVTGKVVVIAHAVASQTGGAGSGSATVALTRAAAPAAALTTPASATAGQAFTVSVTPSGMAPFGYAWTAGSCRVATPGAAATGVTCPATARTASVRVAVTQGDGQQVTRAATVRLTTTGPAGSGSAAGAQAASWSTPRVRDGVLTATLRDAAGHPLARRAATVHVRWRGSASWAAHAALTTDAAGVARVRAAGSRAGWFRLSSPQGGGYQAATSAAAYLTVPVRLSASVASRGHVAATLRTSSGARVRGVTLALQRRVAGTSRWVGDGRARTDRRGRAVRRVRPARVTSYRWVFSGDAERGAATSRSVTLR